VIRQVRSSRKSGDRWDGRGRAGVDDDLRRPYFTAAAAYGFVAGERGARAHEIDAGFVDFRFDAVVPLVANAAHAFHHGGDIDPDVCRNAERGGEPRASGIVRACEKRFRRRTAVIYAAAAEFIALEEHDAFPRFREIHRERNPALAGADDDEIDLFHGLPLHDGAPLNRPARRYDVRRSAMRRRRCR